MPILLTAACLILLGCGVAAQQAFPFERVQNNGAFLRQNHSETTITWIGHATVLIQMDGVNILTDPMWSDRAWPVFGPKRIMPPGLDIDSLPQIDVVVISHNHFDHLDSYSIKRLWKRNRPLFFVPKGIQKWFEAEDISAAQKPFGVQEFAWWESTPAKGITISCVPAAHRSSTIFFTQRDESDQCAGWVFCGKKDTVYFAGDTDYFSEFKAIGERYHPIHVALLPIAPTLGMHLYGQTVVKAFLDLGAQYFVPIHWGTFNQDIVSVDVALVKFKEAVDKSTIPHDRGLWLRHGETKVFGSSK